MPQGHMDLTCHLQPTNCACLLSIRNCLSSIRQCSEARGVGIEEILYCMVKPSQKCKTETAVRLYGHQNQ